MGILNVSNRPLRFLPHRLFVFWGPMNPCGKNVTVPGEELEKSLAASLLMRILNNSIRILNPWVSISARCLFSL
jgi:hypothetical protein